jgi:hypothetical protein
MPVNDESDPDARPEVVHARIVLCRLPLRWVRVQAAYSSWSVVLLASVSPGRTLKNEGKGNLVVLLLAERAQWECARSTRAIEDQPGHPFESGKKPLRPC